MVGLVDLQTSACGDLLRRYGSEAEVVVFRWGGAPLASGRAVFLTSPVPSIPRFALPVVRAARG